MAAAGIDVRDIITALQNYTDTHTGGWKTLTNHKAIMANMFQSFFDALSPTPPASGGDDSADAASRQVVSETAQQAVAAMAVIHTITVQQQGVMTKALPVTMDQAAFMAQFANQASHDGTLGKTINFALNEAFPAEAADEAVVSEETANTSDKEDAEGGDGKAAEEAENGNDQEPTAVAAGEGGCEGGGDSGSEAEEINEVTPLSERDQAFQAVFQKMYDVEKGLELTDTTGKITLGQVMEAIEAKRQSATAGTGGSATVAESEADAEPTSIHPGLFNFKNPTAFTMMMGELLSLIHPEAAKTAESATLTLPLVTGKASNVASVTGAPGSDNERDASAAVVEDEEQLKGQGEHPAT